VRTLSRAAVVGLAGAVAAVVSVGVSTAPVGASDFGGPVVAVRGTDGGLWVNTGAGWGTRGGQLLGAPALARANGVTYYVVVGTDHGLWVRSDAAGWQPLTPSPVYCTSGPGAYADPASSSFTVACRGGDNALWYAQMPLTGGLPQTGSMTSLGGYLSSAPAIAMVGGQPTFAVDGGNSEVFMRTIATPYVATPWWCIGRPALGDAGGTAYFACHGTDNAMWYATNAGSGWSGAQSAGGRLLDGVYLAPVATGAYLYAEGTDRGVWQTSVSASGGSGGGFTNLGGQVGDGFGAGAFPNGDALRNPSCGVPANAMPARGKVIIISLSCQVLSAYQDGRPFLTSLTTTGRPQRPTPRGQFAVLRKNHPWQMISGDPKSSPLWYPPTWVQYVVWFTNQGHGIHDANWEPNSSLGPGSQYNMSVASHGCVHMNTNQVASLYWWADIGTPVLIY